MVLITLAFETLMFFLCSDGLIDSISNSPATIGVILVVFLQAALFYGGNEEFGWRGTMQPILEKAVPSPLAALIVGIVWVSWHIPLWFIEGNSHQIMSFLFFAILGIALSYWLSMIYDVTGAVWMGICIVFDIFGWVIIKHPWSLTLNTLITVIRF